ncbi:MAG TPA: bifunctional adenosylcobinamide kinase/adenosylcobinamide-phosphate guanylyltransferase [Candidatus Faecousia faecigallinarum]|nr:bifunctional adenosylcobinamide kinase/adenosylcobinamide-phosphate guanylyltransferase [Candidatus Faecousia faecigallinarum]
MRALVLGGSKSGKSGLAQALACTLAGNGPLYYWATMEPADGEDRQRIARHLADRAGLGFQTVEAGRDLIQALPQVPAQGTVLLDSVTALLANEMFSPFNPAAPEKALRALLVLGRHCRHVLCVADDIFRDAGRYTGWTEDYRAGLARICRGLAGEFDLVCEAQAGMLRVHKGRLPAGLDCQKNPLGFSDRSLQSATRRNCGP